MKRACSLFRQNASSFLLLLLFFTGAGVRTYAVQRPDNLENREKEVMMPKPDESGTADEKQASPAGAPEMIAATDTPFFLNSDGARVTLQIHAPNGPVRLRKPESREFFLVIENVTCEKNAPNFLVYLNLPPGQNAKTRRDLFAGMMGMFGLRSASSSTSEHGGSGLSFTLDVTDLYHRLQERHLWDTERVTVSFAADIWDAPIPRVKVGRVSLYVQ